MTFERIEEPYLNIDIIVPRDYIGNAMELCQKRRGIYKRMNQLDASRVQLLYEPSAERNAYGFLSET